jgi:ketosteroid isomerase-like protein
MVKRTIILLVLSALSTSFAACHKETEEDMVRNVIASMQKAVEEKQVTAALEHVSRSYQDPQGNNYDGIKGIFAFYFLRHRAVSVSIPSLDITVTNDMARAMFQAILAGRDGGDPANTTILPDTLGVYQFNVVLKKENKAWKVLSATWDRLGAGPSPPQQ